MLGTAPLSTVPLSTNPTFGPGNPDVTLGLTGQAVVCSAGTLGVSRSTALSGQAATSSAGTIASARSVALSGQAVTASAGTLTQAHSLALSGQAATVSAGTIALARSVVLSGQAATGSAGTLTPSMALTLLGQAISGEAGTLVFSVGEDLDLRPGGGIGPIEGSPYKKATKEQIARLRRLMGMDAAEARAFLKANPQQAALALAVFDISSDPDALIDAVLDSDSVKEARGRLKAAADAEALKRIREFIEDETLTLLLILAAGE